MLLNYNFSYFNTLSNNTNENEVKNIYGKSFSNPVQEKIGFCITENVVTNIISSNN